MRRLRQSGGGGAMKFAIVIAACLSLAGAALARFLRRVRFVDLALRSVPDGLIFASPDGHIMFANRSAADIFESNERGLIGESLIDRLAGIEHSPAAAVGDMLRRALLDRTPIEREIMIRGARMRHYLLR